MATVDIHAHTDVHHDEHEHEHHGNFWTNYIFCQDHKIIAKHANARSPMRIII